MVKAMDAAYKAARKAMEDTYSGVLTVTERRKVRNEQTKLTSVEDVVVLLNQPCKLSFESVAPVQQSETAAAVSQTVKLFLAPDVMISPGSKLTVMQNGVTGDYTRSGVAAVYPTHQEIMLELFERWS
jgi:hypothetical protein